MPVLEVLILFLGSVRTGLHALIFKKKHYFPIFDILAAPLSSLSAKFNKSVFPVTFANSIAKSCGWKHSFLFA